MTSDKRTAKEYIDSLPEERRQAVIKLRKAIRENLPEGFSEAMNGMLYYVVPHSLYPAGYHCDPKQPLPFLAIASQKNFIAVYHMGMYADPKLLKWFQTEYPRFSAAKLDMGKSCIRFKRSDQIPFELIGQLAGKMTVDDWITLYEKTFRNDKA